MTAGFRAVDHWPAERVARFANDWRAGMSIARMATVHGLGSERTVQKTAAALGLPLRGTKKPAAAAARAERLTIRCRHCQRPFLARSKFLIWCDSCRNTWVERRSSAMA